MSKLRIVKLGSLEYNIMPTQQAIDRMAEWLKSWNGKGDLEILWAPDSHVEVIEMNIAPGDEIRVESVQGVNTLNHGIFLGIHPSPLWMFVHDCIVHPLVGLFELLTWNSYRPSWLESLWEWTEQKAGF